MRQYKETLYTILDSAGNVICKQFAYDSQCHMYYAIDTNELITDDEIRKNDYQIHAEGYDHVYRS